MTTNTISKLKHEITSRLREIVVYVGMADDSDLAEELEEVQKHVIALDTLTRIPEDLFNLNISLTVLLFLQGTATSLFAGEVSRAIRRRGRALLAIHIWK